MREEYEHSSIEERMDLHQSVRCERDISRAPLGKQRFIDAELLTRAILVCPFESDIVFCFGGEVIADGPEDGGVEGGSGRGR